ncbi:MAG TPA: hypothetical protein VN704_09875 [Verrucomicrobiae bacterium]|nr:hypothetical protein [Verrucomicrobiae bacterium]
MVNILWREGWIKPFLTESLPSENCSICKKEFKNMDFVTSCEFCGINMMHDHCANQHIILEHDRQIKDKINDHKEKRLHSFQ